MDQCVLAIGSKHVAHVGIAVVVLRQYFPNGVPSAHIAPASVEWNHFDRVFTARATLHDGAVNGLRRDGYEFDLARAHEGCGWVSVSAALLPSDADSVQDVWAELL